MCQPVKGCFLLYTNQGNYCNKKNFFIKEEKIVAIKVTISKHGVAYPSKMLATNGGRHIISLKVKTDTDNGMILGKGKFIDLDSYDEDNTSVTFTGVIQKQAANGNWYCECTTASNAYLVYQVPLIAEDYSNAYKAEYNFYNPKDSYVRAYEIAPGDVFELSADLITVNGNELKAGAEVEKVEDRKVKLKASEAA